MKTISLPPAQTLKPIPTPDWKQFVVGKLKSFTPQEDRIRRILFWYKEALIGGLSGRGRIVGRWVGVSLLLQLIFPRLKADLVYFC